MQSTSGRIQAGGLDGHFARPVAMAKVFDAAVQEYDAAFRMLFEETALAEAARASRPSAAKLPKALVTGTDLGAAADATIALLKACARTAGAEHAAREAEAARSKAVPNVDKVLVDGRQQAHHCKEFFLAMADKAGFPADVSGEAAVLEALTGMAIPRLIVDLALARRDLRERRAEAAAAKATCAAAIRRLGEMQTKPPPR